MIPVARKLTPLWSRMIALVTVAGLGCLVVMRIESSRVPPAPRPSSASPPVAPALTPVPAPPELLDERQKLIEAMQKELRAMDETSRLRGRKRGAQREALQREWLEHRKRFTRFERLYASAPDRHAVRTGSAVPGGRPTSAAAALLEHAVDSPLFAGDAPPRPTPEGTPAKR